MTETTPAIAVMAAALALFAWVAVRAGGTVERDAYLSARRTQGSGALSLSFFASALGAWILFSPPEIGTFAGVLGIAGYAVGQATAIAAFAVLGPAVTARLPESTTILEFVSERLGRAMQLWIGGVATLYMFVFLTAELTAVGLAFDRLAGARVVPILAVAAVTAAYTAYGGLPASIRTDRWQAVLTLTLVLVGIVAIATGVDRPIERAVAGGLVEPTRVGAETALVLFIAVVAANLFHQGFWQRSWAALDRRSLVRGALGGGALILPLLFVVAVSGMIAADLGTFDHPSNAFFSLLDGLPDVVLLAVLALVVTLVASTADTLQNGLTSLMATHGRMALPTARMVTIVLTVPAALIAVQGHSVLRLFLVADLLAATVAVPVFLGLWRRTTTGAAITGAAAGLLGIVVLGTVRDGGLGEGLRLLTLPAGPDLGAFVVAVLASSGLTLAVIAGSARAGTPVDR